MATAKKNVTKEKKIVETFVDVVTVTLELSDKEAQAVADVLGRRQSTDRVNTINVYGQLADLGYVPDYSNG